MRNRNKMDIFRLSLLVTFLLAGCSQEKTNWTEFGTFDKAIDIDTYAFHNGSANQIFFKVKAQYPNKDVLAFYKSTITSPWVECSDSKNWESFGDVSGNEPLFIHQIAQRWINRDKKRLLLLAIKYRSKGVEPREHPDNDIQNVYLVEYKQPNLDEAILALGLTCNGA